MLPTGYSHDVDQKDKIHRKYMELKQHIHAMENNKFPTSLRGKIPMTLHGMTQLAHRQRQQQAQGGPFSLKIPPPQVDRGSIQQQHQQPANPVSDFLEAAAHLHETYNAYSVEEDRNVNSIEAAAATTALENNGGTDGEDLSNRLTNQGTSSSQRNEHGSYTTRTRTINTPNVKKPITEIVISAMQSGDLPSGGYWDFFPLPELQDSTLDLGPNANGWTLKLEPISFDADPVVLKLS